MRFMLGDAAIDGNGAFRANMFRVFLVLPFGALSFAITFLPRARPHLEFYCSVAIVLVAAGLFWAMLLLERDGGLGLSSWVGALNYSFVLLFVFLVLGIRFAHAVVVGTMISLMFLAVTFITLDASGLGRSGVKHAQVGFLCFDS
jgi:adenylate cyclase